MWAETLNPLSENGLGAFTADRWGYRRAALHLPAFELMLPSPEWGYSTWIRDPKAALRESELADEFPDCP